MRAEMESATSPLAALMARLIARLAARMRAAAALVARDATSSHPVAMVSDSASSDRGRADGE